MAEDFLCTSDVARTLSGLRRLQSPSAPPSLVSPTIGHYQQALLTGHKTDNRDGIFPQSLSQCWITIGREEKYPESTLQSP